jgi:hypothetical protein
MKIQATTQPAGGPAGQPTIKNPVLVTMDRPVYYTADNGIVPLTRPTFCGRDFAETVLLSMAETLEAAGWSIAHVGVYNARQARRANGAPIRPARWSNHAYGEAMDFKGIVGADRKLIGIAEMKRSHAELLRTLIDVCERRIKALGRRPEIVDEGGWFHIGIWPS